MFSGENKLIADYSIKDWFEAFGARPYPADHPNYRPIAFQFWFMRDLMVVMVFSPVIYILVKYLRIFGVFILGALWLFGFWFNVPGFSIVVFFAFSAGAYFSVQKKNFATIFSSILPYSSVAYLIVALADLCTKEDTYNQNIHIIGIIAGCIFTIGLLQRVLTRDYGKLMKHFRRVLSSCMPIMVPLALFVKLAIVKFPPTSDLAIMTLYLGSATVICVLGVMLYNLLKKLIPAFMSVITEGR